MYLLRGTSGSDEQITSHWLKTPEQIEYKVIYHSPTAHFNPPNPPTSIS